MGTALISGLAGGLLPLSANALERFGKKKSPKNWAWMGPEKDKSDDYWKKKLGNARDCGIDSVLLEVYNGNHAFYETDLYPVEQDVLGQLIPICKSLGLEIHTWMWTMPCNEEKIVKEHQDWYAVNGLGESAAVKPAYVNYYKFLCPCNPEAQEFVRKKVESLAKIKEIDGVHLDYVRLPDVILAEGLQPKYHIVQDKEYPQYDYCYSKYCREDFKSKTGIDPLKDLKDPSANEEWRQFRYDSITNLVNGKLVPEARKYGKKITAAVFPNWQNVRQEWRKWDLDAFLPMLYHNFYNEDVHWIKERTEAEIKDLKHPHPIYSGLFVPALNPDDLAQAVKLAREGGASGITLFNLNSMDEAKWKAFKGVSRD